MGEDGAHLDWNNEVSSCLEESPKLLCLSQGVRKTLGIVMERESVIVLLVL